MEATDTTPAVMDLDVNGLGFWAVVSGICTLDEVRGLAWEKLGPSLLRQKMRLVLHDLTMRGVLALRTPSRPFDADRRCKRCGVDHAQSPILLRMGGNRCFRDIWGGPTPLHTTGLNRRTR